jgi:soluble lytic murein transglycosylase-like protein
MDFVPYRACGNRATDPWADHINAAAQAAGVPPCALAAIVERESNGNPNAKSGDGGWGLCQITSGVDANGVYTPTGQHMLDPALNLEVAAKCFLASGIKDCLLLRERHGDVMNRFSDELLYFAFITYNAGFGTVQGAILNGDDPDRFSTNRYGAGTLALYHNDVAASQTASLAAHA